jgi:hypothetical protein
MQNTIIKYARLPLETDLPELQSETKSLLAGYWGKPHLNSSQYTGDWNVLALRSPGGSIDNVTADLMGATAFFDTPLMLQIPTVQQFVSALGCNIMAVRLLNLRAGAVIMPHRDVGLCYEQGEARLHIPVFTNPLVEFFIEGERIVMQPGECWYINANLTHSVTNAGSEDRVHLVIDCKVNDWLADVFGRGKATATRKPQKTEETQKIIAELRRMDTEVSNKLADDLLKTIQE